MYSAWENGRRQPEPMYRELLAAVLGAPESRFFPAPEQPTSDDEAHAELRRRILVSGTVDSETVALFRAQTERIRMIDRRMGARASADYMASHLDAIEEQLAHALFAGQRGALAAVLADSAALAGWQAVDLGDTTTAWSHFETAKAAAREAESLPLLVHAMAEQAYVLVDVNMDREALTLVQEARRVAGSRVPALLLSWLCAVEAEVRGAAADSGRLRTRLRGRPASPPRRSTRTRSCHSSCSVMPTSGAGAATCWRSSATMARSTSCTRPYRALGADPAGPKPRSGPISPSPSPPSASTTKPRRRPAEPAS